jgi:hypothetical protein
VLESRNIISALLMETLRVSAGRYPFAPAVEHGCEQSSLGAHQRWLLHSRVCNAYEWEIHSDSIKGFTNISVYCSTMM